MNRQEALEVATTELARRRGLPFDELRRRASQDALENLEVPGRSGAHYQLEILYLPDGDDVRVLASIDDGGWRAFVPLCVDFVRRPDGSFVGE